MYLTFKLTSVVEKVQQDQMLTLVEYLLLLYSALLPAPVWYRFFLNKEYGSLFSSLMTGMYLTFKLTSIVEKVQSFFAALKALSRKESHYSAYATSEQGSNGSQVYSTNVVQKQQRAKLLQTGSNAHFGGVSASAIPCLVANTSLLWTLP
ncbi:unnamed protein product [Camellia sinensis]